MTPMIARNSHLPASTPLMPCARPDQSPERAALVLVEHRAARAAAPRTAGTSRQSRRVKSDRRVCCRRRLHQVDRFDRHAHEPVARPCCLAAAVCSASSFRQLSMDARCSASGAAVFLEHPIPSVASMSGAAVNDTFCSRPAPSEVRWDRTRREAAESSVSPGSGWKTLRPSEKPFGKHDATSRCRS
jgi:hypothetical protein